MGDFLLFIEFFDRLTRYKRGGSWVRVEMGCGLEMGCDNKAGLSVKGSNEMFLILEWLGLCCEYIGLGFLCL